MCFSAFIGDSVLHLPETQENYWSGNFCWYCLAPVWTQTRFPQAAGFTACSPRLPCLRPDRLSGRASDAAALTFSLLILWVEVLILNKVIRIVFVTGIRRGWHTWIMQWWRENDSELRVEKKIVELCHALNENSLMTSIFLPYS